MIIDYIPGRSLDKNTFRQTTSEQRLGFYEDLIGILSELRRLEFSTAGSLLLNTDRSSQPAVGGALSIPANELQRYRNGYAKAGPFSTAKEFIGYQHQILSGTYNLPAANSTLESIMHERFALDKVSEQLLDLSDSQWNQGPFILAHQDLRHSNVIVNEDFRMLGIIDWEFTGPIPLQLFTPPPWITGHDLDGMDASQRSTLSSDFLTVPEKASKSSVNVARLKKDWGVQGSVSLAIAQILRRPSCLEAVYYKFIFPTMFSAEVDQVVSDAY